MKATVATPTSDLIVKAPWNNRPIRDDGSLSSTLTADAAPNKPISTPVAEEATPVVCETRDESTPRVVGFDMGKNVYHDNKIMSSEECEELWYSADEYEKFKKELIRTVKTLLKHESKHPSPASIGYLLENVYTTCFECQEETRRNVLPKQLQAAMKNQYRANDEYLLGLERLIVRRIGKDRNELRKCLMEIVKDLQTNKQWPNAETRAESIARVSEEATRSSRLFARCIGSSQVPYLLTRRASDI